MGIADWIPFACAAARDGGLRNDVISRDLHAHHCGYRGQARCHDRAALQEPDGVAPNQNARRYVAGCQCLDINVVARD
jgi:hypothetical protein